MSIRFLYNLGLAPFSRGRDLLGDALSCALSWPMSADLMAGARPGTFVFMADPDKSDTGGTSEGEEKPGTGTPKTDETKKTDTADTEKPETEKTPEKSKEEKAAEKKENEIEEIQRHIRDRIFQTLTTLKYYKEAAPEKEKRHFSKWIRELEKINDEDLPNENALKTILKEAYKKNQLTLSDAEKIIGYNAKDRKECKKTIAALSKVPSYEKKQIFRYKTQEFALEERFDKIFDAIVTRVNRATRFISDHFEKENLIEGAENSLGVNLKPGTKIEYDDPRSGKKAILEIASVETRKKKIKLGKNREDEVWEPLEITTKEPTYLGSVFSIARLDKFLKENHGQEVIENKLKLEEAIGWNLLGLKIEAGTEIEYDAGDPNGSDKYHPTRVKILEITDKEITLEDEVLLNKDTDERKDKLSLGEFAKWMRQTRAQKAIDSIDELREILTTYSKKYAEQHHLKPELYPPIEVKKGEKVYTGGDLNNVRQLKNVTANTVELQNGDQMTFARFLRWVLDHHAQKFDPKNEGEKWKKELEEAGVPKDDAEAAAKKREEELKDAEDAKKKADEEKAKKDKEGKQDKPQETREHAPIHSNAIREWWLKTTWVGPMEIWGLAKAVYEYIGRRHERNCKRRFSAVGKHLPTDVKYEFERINHESEHEEVHKYQEAMKTMSILEIQHIMHSTRKKEQMKACFLALSERGQLRWDDHEMWANLNKQGLPGNLMIPPQKDMPKDKSAIDDYLQFAIDYLWGARTFNDWHSNNNAKYNSQKKQFHEKGDQYEGDPNNVGGVTARLSKLLEFHKKGEWVDPQEYEGLIDFTITKGKSLNEHRLYFLIEGVTAKNNHGQTILSLDRLSALDGTFLNNLPWLDVLTDREYKKGSREKNRAQNKRPWAIEDLEDIAEWWAKAPDAADKPFQANSYVRQFMWTYVLPHPRTYTRIEKGIRNAQNMDHDDAHVIIPLTTDEQVEKTMYRSGAAGELWTDKGKVNAYAGYSQYIKSLAQLDERDRTLWGEEVKQIDRLKRTIKSFVRFDTILSDRYKLDNDGFTRISTETLDLPPVVGDGKRTGGEFREETRNTVGEICRAYGLEDIYNTIYKTSLDPSLPKDEFNENKMKVDRAVEAFGEKFDKKVKENPDLILQIARNMVNGKRLLGMGDQLSSKELIEKENEEKKKEEA